MVWVWLTTFSRRRSSFFRVCSVIASIVGTSTAPSAGVSLDVFAGELIAVDFAGELCWESVLSAFVVCFEESLAGELFAVDLAGELCCELVLCAFVFAFEGERCSSLSLSARRVLLFAAVIAVPASLGVFPLFILVTAGNKQQYKIRQDKTRQDKTRQEKTRQDKTRQDKTRQDKTRQDKIRQDKTRTSPTLT